MSTRAAKVHLDEDEVGTLHCHEEVEWVFDYSPSWLEDPSRPVLGQVFEDRAPGPIEPGGPINWFVHLLPVGPLREWVARSANVDFDDHFGLLVALGQQLPGAVRVTPTLPSRMPAREVPPASPEPAPAFRVAISGAQPKVHLSLSEGRFTVGLTAGSEAWIGKFESSAWPGIVRIEHVTMEWARQSGLQVPQTRILTADQVAGLPRGVAKEGTPVLAVRRFDREGAGRVHMEDLAQVLDRVDMYAGTYEEVAAVLEALVPEEDRERFVRQLVFTIVVGNGDFHLKNLSLLYPDRRRPRLSPAYDLVSTVVWPTIAPHPGLTGWKGTFAETDADSLARLARPLGWSEADLVRLCREHATRCREAWASLEQRSLLTSSERAAIEAHLRKLSL